MQAFPFMKNIFLLSKTQIYMDLKIIIHTSGGLETSKEVVQRLVDQNISTKLDHYLAKFHKADAEGMIDVTVDKNKK